MLEVGLENIKEYVVKESDSAFNLGSGDLLVLSTPILIAFFENTAKDLINKYLDEESSTVGININVDHLAPSKIGTTIKVISRISDINKRIISFELEAFDNDTLIGKGTHKRCIINKEKFLSKIK